MNRSDELIQKAMGRGLTMSERQELRESYNWEQGQKEKSRNGLKDSVKNFKDDTDPLNMPRHRMAGKCADFIECPIDFKCRNYNTAHLKCVNCILHETDEVCMKAELHSEKNFGMLFGNRKRERIDLDDKGQERIR
jgi:hypothetical protein